MVARTSPKLSYCLSMILKEGYVERRCYYVGRAISLIKQSKTKTEKYRKRYKEDPEFRKKELTRRNTKGRYGNKRAIRNSGKNTEHTRSGPEGDTGTNRQNARS